MVSLGGVSLLTLIGGRLTRLTQNSVSLPVASVTLSVRGVREGRGSLAPRPSWLCNLHLGFEAPEAGTPHSTPIRFACGCGSLIQPPIPNLPHFNSSGTLEGPVGEGGGRR